MIEDSIFSDISKGKIFNSKYLCYSVKIMAIKCVKLSMLFTVVFPLITGGCEKKVVDIPLVPILRALVTENSQINLVWTDLWDDESGFKVERKADISDTFALLETVDADVASYIDSSPSEDITYYYRVHAYKPKWTSKYSNEASATIPGFSPSELLATTVDSSSIHLSWTDHSDIETGFRIERKTGAEGTYALVDTVVADQTGYSNTGLSEGTTYYYRICAYNQSGVSKYSNESYATTWYGIPAPPSGLTAISVTSTEINLSWNDNSIDEIGFKIERKTGAGSTYSQIDTVTANTNDYHDAGLLEFTTYFYRVCAYNKWDSNYSNEAFTTTQPAGSLQFSASSYSTNEYDGSVTVYVMRTGGSGNEVSVNYTTGDGSATAAVDYQSSSGSLNWADGESTTKSFSVSIYNDGIYEGNETFTIILSSPTGGASLGSPGTATVTIIDDDPPPPGSLQFSTSSSDVNENSGNLTVYVTRTNGNNGAIGVSYSTSNGSATAGNDYQSSSGSLSWTDGDIATKSLLISILDDSIYEGDETFTVTLSDPSGGASLGSPSTTSVTIIEDEPLPPGSLQFETSSYNVDENSGSVSVYVTRTNGSNGAVGIDYTTSDGSAMAGSDYQNSLGSLSWADGETTPKSISVNIFDDAIYESTENFLVTLSNPSGGASLGNPNTATVTILNDDPNDTLFEGATSQQLSITRFLNNTYLTESQVVRMGQNDAFITSNGFCRGFVWFDLSTLPIGCTIQEVTLECVADVTSYNNSITLEVECGIISDSHSAWWNMSTSSKYSAAISTSETRYVSGNTEGNFSPWPLTSSTVKSAIQSKAGQWLGLKFRVKHDGESDIRDIYFDLWDDNDDWFLKLTNTYLRVKYLN